MYNHTKTKIWTILSSTRLCHTDNALQHTATRCNTLQHTATHCNTLQHTATYCNTLQHTAAHSSTLHHTHPERVRRQRGRAQRGQLLRSTLFGSAECYTYAVCCSMFQYVAVCCTVCRVLYIRISWLCRVSHICMSHVSLTRQHESS